MSSFNCRIVKLFW